MIANAAQSRSRTPNLTFMALGLGWREGAVDHARNHNALKRGGEFHILTLNDEIDKAAEEDTALIELDDALNELAKMDAVKAKIVELRYFGGLTMDEVAEVLGVSVVTVKRHWKMAKAWLYGRLAK